MKLKTLKVRPKKLLEASPCIGEMGAMLECWSRAGVDDPRCAQTAKALANCMSKPVSKPTAQDSTNVLLKLTIFQFHRSKSQSQQTQSITIWLDWANNFKQQSQSTHSPSPSRQ